MKDAHMHKTSSHASPHRNLLVMVVLSFVAMYFLMYAMVDARRNVYASLNQAYMAGLMAAPMIAIELLLMRTMYRNKKLNLALLVTAVIALGSCWLLIRAQVGIFRPAISPIDDSSPCGCDPNVRAGLSSGSRDQGAL